MPRNGSGTYSLPQPAFVANTTISSSAMNSDLSDIASALTQSVSSDGQTSLTGSLQGFAGNAATPSYAFVGNASTGMYPAAGGTIGFSVSSTQIAGINTTGIIGKSLGIISGAGFGSAVTQTGSVSSTVTINNICGTITTVSNTWTVGSTATFLVSNSLVTASDVIVFSTAQPTVFGYLITAAQVQNGSFVIGMEAFNNATEAVRINFMVLHSVNT